MTTNLIAAQAVILGMISGEFPDHALLSEEGAAHLLDHSWCTT